MYFRGTQLICACVAVLVSMLSIQNTASAEETAYGYWKAIDKDSGKTQSIFRIWEDKGKLVGKIVKTFPKPNGGKAQEICTECPGAQKDKPVLGLIFLWGLEKDKENPRKWVDGKVLNPEDGKTYNAELEFSPEAKTLTIYGYIKMLVKLGGTNVWKRPTPEELQGVPGAS
jgi:uncharacterized protein (DUF2147 family)